MDENVVDDDDCATHKTQNNAQKKRDFILSRRTLDSVNNLYLNIYTQIQICSSAQQKFM